MTGEFGSFRQTPAKEGSALSGLSHRKGPVQGQLGSEGGDVKRVSTSSDYVRVMDQRLCQWLLCQANSYPVR